MSQTSRFVIGLDLGTTNSALAYVDTTQATEAATIELFAIPQVVAANEVGEEPLLPSFLYLPAEGEFDRSLLALPWSKASVHTVGKFAREHGSLIPTRLVSSAKSWLCHPSVDRRGKILPWTAEASFHKISPLEAQVRILEHLRDAWNATMAAKDKAARLEQQDIVLTVPASFDAVARELTAEAAREAGLERVTLFEEPQAAFYAWIHQSGEQWRRQVKPGDVALVVDVGGGTTDLTLIGVAEERGDLILERLAVGDHLLLGGDNMDLTLAHQAAHALAEKGTRLDSAQMLALWHACRSAKEKLFENPRLKSHAVTVLGRGRKVVGGTIRTELTRELVEQVLVEGFFPRTSPDSQPKQQRQLGLQELGLGYAADPAVTKHLAAFLSRHADSIGQFVKVEKGGRPLPTAVLFNGGVFQAQPLRERVLDVLASWTERPLGEGIRELPAAALDRAVAVGAAYYGLVRRGKGIRIRGGVPRSYYIGIESAVPAVPGFPPPIKALCVVPQGTEEGSETSVVEREFGLVVGEPVQFRFLGSTQRRDDQVGTVIDDWQETIQELAPLETTLTSDAPQGQVVPVQLHTRVTEVGTLELWCESRDGKNRWKLEFNVRETS